MYNDRKYTFQYISVAPTNSVHCFVCVDILSLFYFVFFISWTQLKTKIVSLSAQKEEMCDCSSISLELVYWRFTAKPAHEVYSSENYFQADPNEKVDSSQGELVKFNVHLYMCNGMYTKDYSDTHQMLGTILRKNMLFFSC